MMRTWYLRGKGDSGILETMPKRIEANEVKTAILAHGRPVGRDLYQITVLDLAKAMNCTDRALFKVFNRLEESDGFKRYHNAGVKGLIFWVPSESRGELQTQEK